MNNLFKNILGISSAASFAKKSSRTLQTFSKVMEDLSELNDKAFDKQIALKEEAWNINREMVELENITQANSKIISNIQNILK